MRVHFYSAVEQDDGKHLGTWYSDLERMDFPQVPRIGDTVWLETRDIQLSQFVVTDVQWSFKNRAILNETPIPRSSAEVYVKPAERDGDHDAR